MENTAAIKEGARVRLIATPTTVGSVTRTGKSTATVVFDGERRPRTIPRHKLEPKRGNTPGTVAPKYSDPGRKKVTRVMGARLRARCDELGMSLNQLAQRADVSRSTVTRILNGTTVRVWVDTAESLAAAVGISPSEFWIES